MFEKDKRIITNTLKFETPPVNTRPGWIDKMDYREMWIEEKVWLVSSIRHIEGLILSVSEKERMRLLGKLDGLKTALGHMNDSERLYKNT